MKLKRPNGDMLKEMIKAEIKKRRAPPDWQREKIELAKRIIETEEKLITVNVEMRERLIQLLDAVQELTRVTKKIHKYEEVSYVE